MRNRRRDLGKLDVSLPSGHVLQYCPKWWSRLAMFPLARQQGRSVVVLTTRDGDS